MHTGTVHEGPSELQSIGFGPIADINHCPSFRTPLFTLSQVAVALRAPASLHFIISTRKQDSRQAQACRHFPLSPTRP